MNSNERLKKTLEMLKSHDQCDDEYEVLVFALAAQLSGAAREVLRQLISEGPVYDGDLVCKSGRDDLLACRLAVKVVAKGQQGYQAATYLGWAVARELPCPLRR